MITIVAYLEEGGYVRGSLPWQRLADCFDAELHLLNEYHNKGFQDLDQVLTLYSHRPWIRLTPHGQLSLEDFDHQVGEDPVYFVGKDADKCPEIRGAFDITIPVSRELHAYTAMTIAMWDRRMKV